MENVREEIGRVARDFYLKSGLVEGHDLDNWLAAEKLVFSWLEPDQEREQHVAAVAPVQDEHTVEPTHDEVVN